jgi:hypothetical protein
MPRSAEYRSLRIDYESASRAPTGAPSGAPTFVTPPPTPAAAASVGVLDGVTWRFRPR